MMALATLVGLAACARGVTAPAATEGQPPPAALVAHEAATSAAASGVQNVKVVNTPADWLAPVPTVAQGTTTVAGTLAATQSGSWSVGLTGSPTMSVSNFPSTLAVSFASPPSVTAALDPSQTVAPSSTFGNAAKAALVTVNAYEGRTRWYAEVTAGLTPGSQYVGLSNLNLGGKRLVIEYLSARIAIDAAAQFTEALAYVQKLDAQNNGIPRASVHLAPVLLGTVPNGSGSTAIFTANQSLRVYAEDGDQLIFYINTNRLSSDGFGGLLSIHGYLIDP